MSADLKMSNIFFYNFVQYFVKTNNWKITLIEGIWGSNSSSDSALFWAVFRPPNTRPCPPKKYYSVLHYLVPSSGSRRTEYCRKSVLRDLVEVCFCMSFWIKSSVRVLSMQSESITVSSHMYRVSVFRFMSSVPEFFDIQWNTVIIPP